MFFCTLLRLPLFFLRFLLRNTISLPHLLPSNNRVLFSSQIFLRFLPSRRRHGTSRRGTTKSPSNSTTRLHHTFATRPDPRHRRRSSTRMPRRPILYIKLINLTPSTRNFCTTTRISSTRNTNGNVTIRLTRDLRLRNTKGKGSNIYRRILQLQRGTRHGRRRRLTRRRRLPPIRPLRYLGLLPRFFYSRRPRHGDTRKRRVIRRLVPPTVRSINTRRRSVTNLNVNGRLTPRRVNVNILRTTKRQGRRYHGGKLKRLPIVLYFRAFALFSNSVVVRFATISSVAFACQPYLPPRGTRGTQIPFPVPTRSIEVKGRGLMREGRFLM